jgi:hypothetical protein
MDSSISRALASSLSVRSTLTESVSPPLEVATAAIADCTTSSASLNEETTSSTTLAKSDAAPRRGRGKTIRVSQKMTRRVNEVRVHNEHGDVMTGGGV